MTWTNPMAWLLHAIAEAAFLRGIDADVDLAEAWTHLQERLSAGEQLMVSTEVNKNWFDYEAGMRHLMFLLAVETDVAPRVDPDPVLAVDRSNMDDIMTWGLDFPDCLYMSASLRGGETYRPFGNRGTACYVGRHAMDGIAATTNYLVDDLEVDSDGNFEAILSAQEQEGNWLTLAGDDLTLTIRNCFNAWDAEVPASLQIERVAAEVGQRDQSVDLDVAVSRRLSALGEFVYDNLKLFLTFGAMSEANDFCHPWT